jgi:hypothetical protein
MGTSTREISPVRNRGAARRCVQTSSLPARIKVSMKLLGVKNEPEILREGHNSQKRFRLENIQNSG